MADKTTTTERGTPVRIDPEAYRAGRRRVGEYQAAGAPMTMREYLSRALRAYLESEDGRAPKRRRA